MIAFLTLFWVFLLAVVFHFRDDDIGWLDVPVDQAAGSGSFAKLSNATNMCKLQACDCNSKAESAGIQLQIG